MKEGWVAKHHYHFEILACYLGRAHALQVASILTYDEMMETPKSPPNTWNVIVMPGDGDDSANRSDVLGTYLLFH